MNSDEHRIRRTRLLAGIIVGIVVGTVHALATHVASRVEPETAAVLPYERHVSGGDGRAR